MGEECFNEDTGEINVNGILLNFPDIKWVLGEK